LSCKDENSINFTNNHSSLSLYDKKLKSKSKKADAMSFVQVLAFLQQPAFQADCKCALFLRKTQGNEKKHWKTGLQCWKKLQKTFKREISCSVSKMSKLQQQTEKVIQRSAPFKLFFFVFLTLEASKAREDFLNACQSSILLLLFFGTKESY